MNVKQRHLPPNVVLLVLDTQRADRLSCYGYPLPTSPNLDKFAAEATLFTHAIAPAQWTIPSHASMFTGLYPSRHGLLQMDGLLPAAIPTLAERLQQVGYYTAGFSNNIMVGVIENGLERGFDHLINYAGAQYKKQQNQSEKKGRLHSQIFKLLSWIEQSSTAKKIAMSPLFLPIANTLFWRSVNVKGDTSQSLADAAQLLIERPGISKDQPVFVFINLMGTHRPYDPPKWAIERYTKNQMNIGQFNAAIRDLGDVLERPLSPTIKETIDHIYNAEILAQDQDLGIFLEQIRTINLMDNTLFIIVADHGEHLGEKQLLGHDYGAFADTIHVPLIIWDPTGVLVPGTQYDRPVSIRRIFHTILAFANKGKLPESELALAITPENNSDMPVFAEAWPRQQKLSRLEKARVEKRGFHQEHMAVHDGSHKLIAIPQKALGLYHLARDPQEKQDLQDSLPDQVEKQYKQLLAFMEHPKAIVSLNPSWDVNAPLLRRHLHELGYMERPNS